MSPKELRDLRIALGMSVSEFAQRLRMSEALLHDIETGDRRLSDESDFLPIIEDLRKQLPQQKR